MSLLLAYKNSEREGVKNSININSVHFHDFVLKLYSEYFQSFSVDVLYRYPSLVLREFKKIVYEVYETEEYKLDFKEWNVNDLLSLYTLLDYTLAEEKCKSLLYKPIKETKTKEALYFFIFIDKGEISFNACCFLLRENPCLYKREYFDKNLNLLGRLVNNDKIIWEDKEKEEKDLYLQASIYYQKKMYKEARNLYRKNWEESKHSYSLHKLAYMIDKGKGGYQNLEEARFLYKKNWEEFENSNSLNNLASMIEEGHGGYQNKEEAYSLYKKNWEEFENNGSLNNLACIIENRDGYKNRERARDMFKKNWEENKNNDSLYNLASMIQKGEGGYQNLEEARFLFKKNWEENKDVSSMHRLAYMIYRGQGGYQNEEEARGYIKKWEDMYIK